MILTGAQIGAEVARGRIRISEFDSKRLSPDSYDLTLGDVIEQPESGVLDARGGNAFHHIEIPEDGYRMSPGEFVVAESREAIGSDAFVPLLHGRSGLARAGVFSHITADLLQLGFYGRCRLQIYAVLPFVLTRGMDIAQISFWVPTGDRHASRPEA